MDLEADTSQAPDEHQNDVEENIEENDNKDGIDVDDDYDEDAEYEETYLYVDFETKLLEEQLLNPNLQIKVLGIDTDAPIVQLNNKIFKGRCTDGKHYSIRFSFTDSACRHVRVCNGNDAVPK